MRAPSKRWLALAGVVIVSTTLAWSFTRLHHTEKIDGTSTPGKKAVRESNPLSSNRAELIDSDNDGIPDPIELRSFQDRDSFRRWFTAIAETQFYQLSDQWNAEQRDCAGLARFAMREALRHHDRIWFQKMGPAYQTVAPDVKSFDLDNNPLGEKIFRTDFGSFGENDITNGRFSGFADARTLKNFNVVFISRDRREAQPGDLLFYYQPWVQKYSVSRDGISGPGAYRVQWRAGLGCLSHWFIARRQRNGQEGRAFSARSASRSALAADCA